MTSNFNVSTSGAEIVASFPASIKGRIFAITGPTPGSLGAQSSLFLARGQPSILILLGRSASKAEPFLTELATISPNTKFHFVPLDLQSFDAIKAAAVEVKKLVDHIDVLINNAGIMALKEYSTTPDSGVETQLAVNHIGHFLLTAHLLPLVLKSLDKNARIVNVSSNGHQMQSFRFDDYNFNNGKDYNRWRAYGQSKSANLLFTIGLAEKLKGKGVKVFAIHPGQIETALGADVEDEEWPVVEALFAAGGSTFDGINKNLEQGTSTTLRAALDPSLDSFSGSYLSDCQVTKTPEYAHDPELAKKLWSLSEKIVGEKFEI